MKKLYSLFATLIVLTVWSCEEVENMDALGNWEIGKAALSAPAPNASIILDEATPSKKIKFEWQAAITTNRFLVAYTVVLVPAASTDYANPIISITPANGGKDVSVEITSEQLDYALWAHCYPEGGAAALKWVVLSKAIEKQSVAEQNLSVTRFESERIPETLFITGAATEKGTDATQAIAMRALVDGDENPTNVFDVYTTLTQGSTFQFRDQAAVLSKPFGGNEGTLAGCGPGITVEETGQYRVTVNLNNNTYELLKIDRWSLVGGAVEGGWGGDVPLTYQGNGIWSAKLPMYKPDAGAGFIFRANGDWGYLLKRIKTTSSDLVMESEGNANGIEFEDIPGPEEGLYNVTLNLGAGGWKYSLVKEVVNTPAEAIIGKTENTSSDAVSGNFVFGTYDAPEELFLLSEGAVISTLTKDGTAFKSVTFLALQQSKTYTLNSKSDGTGTVYNEIGDGSISVARDEPYQITVDFATGKLAWKYYNMKLFHWDEDGGGWDARQELLMTYTHPYKYEVTGTLAAGFHSKFNSPWEVEFGVDADGTALTGTMKHGGTNFKGIVQSGTYKASLTVADDYKSATYAFVKQ